MGDTVFREAPPLPDPIEVEANRQPEPEIVRQGQAHDVKDIQPVESKDQAVLNALNIGEEFKMLPENEKANVTEIAQYVSDLLQAKGVVPTQQAFNTRLNQLKEQLGLEPDTMAEVALDKLGGIVRAWKGLAFMDDEVERKNLFYKLARMKSSKDMNNLVFEEMNRKKIWQ